VKLFSTNTIAVPKDLSALTQSIPGQEVDPQDVGMTGHQRDLIWAGVENFYRISDASRDVWKLMARAIPCKA
jgi:hypothetical protein